MQTVASAAGTLSSIIFVLPGLVMIGWWTGFPYWVSFAICALGGILGVMYSIPLRRALVTNSDLPYPEGVACAEVLKVGSRRRQATARAPRKAAPACCAVIWGAIGRGGVRGDRRHPRVRQRRQANYFRVGGGNAASPASISRCRWRCSRSGHLVGLWVGIAMLLGALIGWGWGVPHFSALLPHGRQPAEDIARRDAGASRCASSAPARSAWPRSGRCGKLVKPVVSGLRVGDGGHPRAQGRQAARAAAHRAGHPDRHRRHDHGRVLRADRLAARPLQPASGLGAHMWTLVIGGLIYIVVMSFFVSAVCGYMAGLIGSSNSPLSGIGILVVIGAALLLVFGVKPLLEPRQREGPGRVRAVRHRGGVRRRRRSPTTTCRTSRPANSSTPRRRQAAVGAGRRRDRRRGGDPADAVDLVNHAYGFAGAPGADPTRALAAPQAGLISALAQGVIQNNIDWSLIGIGACIGVGADRARRRAAPQSTKHRAPVAAGRGPGHLPADLGDADGGRRRVRRLRSTTAAPSAARARKRASSSACCWPPA